MKKLFLFLSLMLLPFVGFAQEAENWENDYANEAQVRQVAVHQAPPTTDDPNANIKSDPNLKVVTSPVGKIALPILAFLAAYGAILLVKKNKQTKNA